jgi:hypothetical protein
MISYGHQDIDKESPEDGSPTEANINDILKER